MPLSSVSDLMRRLEACRLLDAEQLAEVQAGMAASPATPGDVLRQLVQQGRLTRWQADRLNEGQAGFHFGKYLLLDQLGSGGMGTVFRARQTGMGRVVALKVMSRKLIRDAQSLARFQREIQAAAALQHPNIVLALDADSHHGVPYLVMEFVDGKDLRTLLRQQGRLPIGLACEYARQAALGLQQAHERGMVHRDIKPANLLLTRSASGRPLVKILDFGLARFQSESRETGEITRTGEIMGTPDYISPEQASDTRSADIRSDIYSLGCTLYHWLAGSVPFPGNTLMERLMARATRDPTPLSQMRSDVPAELSAVVQRMLDRDPAQRNQTPAQVADALAHFCVMTAAPVIARPVASPAPSTEAATQELSLPTRGDGDLQQFLAVLDAEATLPGGTVETQGLSPGPDRPQVSVAVPPAPASRLQRSLRRHAQADRRRGWVAAAVVGVVALLVGGLALWQSGNRTTLVVDWPLPEREDATLEADGRALRLPASSRFELSGPVGRRSLRLTRKGYEPVEFQRELARGVRETISPQWLPNAATRRALAWKELAGRATAAKPAGALNPALIENSAEIRSELVEFQRQHRGHPEAVAASALARDLPWPVDTLSASGPNADKSQPHVVGVLGDARWKYTRGNVTAVAFDATGRWVIASGLDRRVSIWDPQTGLRNRRFDLENYPLVSISLRPEADRLIVTDGAGLIALLSLPDGSPLWSTKWNHGLNGYVAASKDGRQLVGGIFNGSIKRINPDDGQILSSLADSGSDTWLRALAMSPSGRYVAASRGVTLQLWDGPEATEPRDLDTVGDYAPTLAFTADERWLVSPCQLGPLKVWDTATWQPRELPGPKGAQIIAAHPEKPWIAAAVPVDSQWQVLVLDLDDFGAVLHQSPRFVDPVTCLAWHPQGMQLVVGDQGGHLRLWSLDDPQATGFANERLTCFAMAPDGQTIYTGNSEDHAAEWNPANAAERGRWPTAANGLSAIAVSHDGRILATGGFRPDPVHRTITLWDAGTHRKRCDTPSYNSHVMSLAFSPDDRLLAAALFDGTTRLYDVATGQQRQSLPGCEHTRMDAFSVAFIPDGRMLATGYWIWEKPIRLWDLGTNPVSERRWLTGHANNVHGVTFSPLGDLLISASEDETVRLWNPTNGKQQDYLPSHTGGALCVAASPDGLWLAVGEGSGFVSLWPLVGERVVPKHRVRLGRFGESVLQVQFTPDSRHVLALVDNGTVAIVRLAEWTSR
uniref:Protein kinase domain-containing protein n=1 Tax=Schlesneria paludicola TaxID=360056 RepID=A0A7C2JXV3_9PLAN